MTIEKMKSLAVIFLLVIQVQAQDNTSDITYSGDGEDLLPTTSYASLIDENGDIENSTTLDSITVFPTIEKDTSPLLFLNDFSSISTTPEEVTSTVVTVGTPQIIHVTNDSLTTTESSTIVTTTTESTTVTDLPTTTIPSILGEDTTTTYKSTTNTPTWTTTVTERTESELEPTKAQQISTEKTNYIPANGEKHCSIVDSNLICEEEIFCYGEGIIDCTEEIVSESSPEKMIDFLQKSSSSSASDEYSEYDEVEEGIETFPPYLVGVKSSKKSLPFLFKMGSLGTTESISETTGNTKETFTKVTHPNLPSIEEVMNEDTSGSIQTESVLPDSTFKSLETIDDLKDMTSSTIFSFDANYSQEYTHENNSVTEMTVKMNATEDSVTSNQTDTREVTTEIFSSSVTEVTSEKPINVRKKREESIISSSKLSLNAAAVENSRKMSAKACKLIGNLVCKPSPTKAKCRGKATCQVPNRTEGTSEKSTSTKGVENWAIAVIAICAVAAALTVSLLVYLIFTSWKKLKVQPQNGVTTLTYVNSTIP